MASAGRVVRVYCLSHCKDFHSERDRVDAVVVPELEKWGSMKEKERWGAPEKWDSPQSFHVELSHITWGGDMNPDALVEKLVDISQGNSSTLGPYFIYLTRTELGVVPMWGDVDQCALEGYRNHTGLTEVEMEIFKEAYKQDVHNLFLLMRNDWHPPDGDPDAGLPSSHPDITGASKARLRTYPLSNVIPYCHDRENHRGGSAQKVANLPGCFAEGLLRSLKCRISQEITGQQSLGDDLRHSQAEFVTTYAAMVRGRKQELSKLEEYVRTGGKDVPLLLLGDAGCGKMSILAKLAHNLPNSPSFMPMKSEGWSIFYHFVGCTPGSTSLENMLQEIAKELNISEPVVPHNLPCLAQSVCSALGNPDSRPIVIIVDGLEKFHEESGALVTSWIPRKLPPNTRCILSFNAESSQHSTLMSRESKPEEFAIGQMDRETKMEIIHDLFGAYHRRLSNVQMAALLQRVESETPLWLVTACEELRLLDTDQELERCIQNLPAGLLDLYVEVLERYICVSSGSLLAAMLCLIECSRMGLYEEELMALLADQDSLTPPSPYDEKDEKESSEKEDKSKKSRPLCREKWSSIYKLVQPLLQPYAHGTTRRLCFHHQVLSKAVRLKFLKISDDENADDEESREICAFWHHKLAEYFEHCDNIDRIVEEYLYHLVQLEDETRLCQALCDWNVIDRLYSEEYSSSLLTYWRKAGGDAVMIEQYRSLLENLEEQGPRNEQQIALRHEHIARIFLQAGKYSESRELTKVAMKLEEKELGNRPERMVELYGQMSEIFDEKSKLNDFVSPSQLPELRKTISYGRKSIELRKGFNSGYHKFKLAMSLMKLAFSLESWEGCGGDEELSGEDALKEGNTHIDTALAIFKELNDDGHYAEALMTKGVLAPRGSLVQLKFYNEAMEICLQVYGEHSLLTSRLYINIGIVYEDNKDYVKAYECFRKWSTVSEAVLGPTHPKTLRAKGVLKEPRYRLIALRLKRQDEESPDWDGLVHNDHMSESSINQEVEELDEEYHGLSAGISGIESDDEERADGEPLDMLQDLPISDIQELYLAFSDLIHQATLAQLERAHDLVHGQQEDIEMDNQDPATNQEESPSENQNTPPDNRDMTDSE